MRVGTTADGGGGGGGAAGGGGDGQTQLGRHAARARCAASDWARRGHVCDSRSSFFLGTLCGLLLSTLLSSLFTWQQGHVLGGHHGDTDGGGVDQRIGAQQQRVERLQHANKACPPTEHPLCF